MSDGPKTNRIRVRRLSRFLCREMLYDYVTKNLDADRKRAMEEYLKNSEEQREELEQVKYALDYCEDLAKTSLSQPLVEELVDQARPLSAVLQNLHWRQWPEAVRWSVEGLVAAAFVSLLVAYVPWETVRSWFPESPKKYVLAEKEKRSADVESEVLVDEMPTSASPTATPSPADPDELAADNTASVKPKDESSPPVLVAKKQGQTSSGPVEVRSKMMDENMDPAPAAVVTDKAGTADKALKGYLFRAEMTGRDLDATAALMKTEIEKLGGEKAGQVDLGWKRSEDSRYFHFTLLESNYEALLRSLRHLGPVRIYKEGHWRVMPQGQIRIILTLEEEKK